MAWASTPKVVLGCIAFIVFWILAVFPAVPFLPIGRTAGSLLGASLMVVFQVISPNQAFDSVDLPILGLLFGTMVVSVYLERADCFKYLGSALSWKSRGPKDLLCRICLLSAISSALFTNDTTCVIFTEFVLKLCKQHNVPVLPFLMALATSSNIGSAATAIGNPQNLVIAVQSKISFFKFLIGVLPAMALGIVVNTVLLMLFYWRSLSPKNRPNAPESVKGAEEAGDVENPKTIPMQEVQQSKAEMEAADQEAAFQLHQLQLQAAGIEKKISKSDANSNANSNSVRVQPVPFTPPASFRQEEQHRIQQNHGRTDEEQDTEDEQEHMDYAPAVMEDLLGLGPPNRSFRQHHRSSSRTSRSSSRRSDTILPVHSRSGSADCRTGTTEEVPRGTNGLPEGVPRCTSVSRDDVPRRSPSRRSRLIRRRVWKTGVYGVTLAMLAALLYGLNLSWSALTAAVALIVLDFSDAGPCLDQVSYSLLVFFSGMFITVDGFNRTGAPGELWKAVEPHARIDSTSGIALLSLVVILLSNVASNVPTVLLLGARVAASAAATKGASVDRAWLMLAWVSTVAGNLTLVGSAANLIVSEQARRAENFRYNLSFWKHLMFGVPSTFIVIAVGLPLIQ